VGYENDSLAHFLVPAEFGETFGLKVGIPHGEDLVHEKDVAVGVDGDGERESDLHPATVILEFLVDEPFQFGKGDDRVELLVDLFLGHAEHRRIEIHIVPTGELGIEPDTEFEERRNHPVDFHVALVGLIDTGQHLQKGRLSGAVAPYDTEKFPFFHLERDVIERLEFFIRNPSLPSP